ncbi:MAG: hypothetical protein JO304_18285 [Solirubrobacterales bacterium]|nr:hypothetical protein [Solirubrobacterales bacterium]
MLNPYLTQLVVEARIADLRARAARHRSAISEDPWSLANGDRREDETMTLRVARPGDDEALARLAALVSAAPLSPPVLIAEIGGEMRAALSLSDDKVVADPFQHTLAAQQLLRARAAQLQGNRRPSWRRRLLDRANPRARAATPSAAMRGATSQSNQ